MSSSALTAVRFQQLNQLIDEVAPQLPNSSHVAVMMICFRHARRDGTFRLSINRLARSAVLKQRQIKRIMRSLESLGAIELVSEHRGPIPRCYRITGVAGNT